MQEIRVNRYMKTTLEKKDDVHDTPDAHVDDSHPNHSNDKDVDAHFEDRLSCSC